MTFEEFCARLTRLRIDRGHGHPKPYKPLLVLALVILIHKGKIRSPRVFLDAALRSTFEQLLREFFPDWPFDARIEYPFRHLELWRLVPEEGRAALFAQSVALSANALSVMRNVACAQLDDDVFLRLAADAGSRARVVELLVRNPDYGFPPDARRRLAEWMPPDPEVPLVAADSAAVVAADLTERAVEEYLQAHWPETAFAAEGIRLSDRGRDGLPCRQVITPVNNIDLLGRDAFDWWVIELKRGDSDDKVVGQTSRYLGWMQRFHGPARGAVVVDRATEKLEYAVRAHKALTLWEYDRSLELRRVV